jgi:uncharacterized membrane protein
VSAANQTLARRWRGVTLGAVAALLVVVFSWQLVPALSVASTARGLLLSLPLLFPLHGLWHGKRYTYRWATLCVLPYFAVGLTEVVANPSSRPWTAAMLGFALTWFVGLVAYLRVTSTDRV